jgi:hemoglobin-like flavoprotein
MKTYLTGQQVLLLKKSFRQMNPPQVAARFYSTLFQQHPEVKPMFPADTVELGSKLMSVFELVVFSFDEKEHGRFGLQDVLIKPLRALGRKHDDKGVKPEHYEIANGLLLKIMKESGESFTTEMYQSWQLALEHLTYAMQDKSVDSTLKSSEQTTTSIRDMFANILQNLKKQVS